jgi:hypothetical protein
MPYYDVLNLVTNKDKIWSMVCHMVMKPYEPLVWEYGTKSPAELVQLSQLISKSPTDLGRGLSSSKIRLSQLSYLIPSWMHFHHCRCVQDHVRMLLHSLTAICKSPGVAGSNRTFLEALVRATAVFRRSVHVSWTEIHFPDVWRTLQVHLTVVW